MTQTRTVAHTCILIGLLPLLPVPLVDDLLRRHLARGLYAQLAAAHGHPTGHEALAPLSEGRGNLLLGCLIGVTWGILKKLAKTVLYLLTVKELGDWAAEAGVRAELVRRAFAAGALPARPAKVRDLMDAAWAAHGRSPLLALLRGEAKGWQAGGAEPEARLIATLTVAAGGPAVIAAFDEALRREGLTGPAALTTAA